MVQPNSGGCNKRLVDEHLPQVARRMIATTIGPIAVLSAGPSDGQPVVLLHGSGSNSTLLGAHDPTPVRRVPRPRRQPPREPGPSTATRVPFRAADQADWSAQVVRAVADRPAAVVGVSIGGWIATALAARNPDLVAHLVLQSASGFGPRRVLPLVLGWRPDGARRTGASICAFVPHRSHAAPSERTPMNQDLDAFSLRTFEHFRPRTDPLPEHDSADLQQIRARVSAAYGNSTGCSMLEPLPTGSETSSRRRRRDPNRCRPPDR